MFQQGHLIFYPEASYEFCMSSRQNPWRKEIICEWNAMKRSTMTSSGQTTPNKDCQYFFEIEEKMTFFSD